MRKWRNYISLYSVALTVLTQAFVYVKVGSGSCSCVSLWRLVASFHRIFYVEIAGINHNLHQLFGVRALAHRGLPPFIGVLCGDYSPQRTTMTQTKCCPVFAFWVVVVVREGGAQTTVKVPQLLGFPVEIPQVQFLDKFDPPVTHARYACVLDKVVDVPVLLCNGVPQVQSVSFSVDLVVVCCFAVCAPFWALQACSEGVQVEIVMSDI